MTKPKKWFLKEEAEGIVIHNSDGPLCKRNASSPLGVILEVVKAPDNLRGNHTEEGVVLVSVYIGTVRST